MTKPRNVDALMLGMDLLMFFQEHAAWSEKTFGTTAERGPVGPLKHLAIEALEAIAAWQNREDKYTSEIADLGLLLCDIIRRSGMTLRDLVNAMNEKLAVCKLRHYPKVDPEEPSEHDRSHEPYPGKIVAVPVEAVYGYNPNAPRMRPTIVCLCGSTKFKQEFIEANFKETMAGRIVLSVGWFSHADGSVYTPTEDEKKRLDELHLRKIDLADEILVLNKNGYIGDSTQREITYATQHNKGIRYYFPNEAPEQNW